MNLNMVVDFELTKNLVRCVILLNGEKFDSTKRITSESDRISGIKRAKQAAYCGAMVKVHGYVCNRLINEK